MEALNETRLDMIKKAVMSFRVVDLRECLKFLEKPVGNNVRKSLLQKKVIDFIEEKFLDNDVPAQILVKVLRIESRLKETRRNRCWVKRKINTLAEKWESPFFDTVDVLQSPIQIRKKAWIYLNIPNNLMKLFHRRRTRSLKFTYEVQMRFGTSDNSEFSSTAIQLEINKKHNIETLDSPPIFYVTPYFSFRYNAQNEIAVEFPFTEKEYTVSVYIVKRITPLQLLQNCPVKEVTKVTDLVKKYFKENGTFVHEVFLFCPIEKKLMKNPCRSSVCNHPDVFDLNMFLERVQYHTIWKCPICSMRITYDTLEREAYFRIFMEKGKVVFTFYTKRETEKFSDRKDPSILSVTEIITID